MLTQQSYQFLFSSLLLPFSRGITSLEYFDHWEAKVYEYPNLCAFLILGESLKVLAQENKFVHLLSKHPSQQNYSEAINRICVDFLTCHYAKAPVARLGIDMEF